MQSQTRFIVGISLVALAMAIGISIAAQGQAQGQAPGQGQGRGGPGGGGRGPAAVLPATPTAVPLPTVTGPITGPGGMYESVQSLAPGGDLSTFKYEAKEYVITGTAQGQLYRTRIVVRKPANPSKFSGLTDSTRSPAWGTSIHATT